MRFGLVPEEEQGRFLQQLLPWEHGFWYGQEEIGYTKDYSFNIPVRDDTSFCHKPIYCPPKAREWLLEYMQSLESLGVVRKVDTLRENPPTFTCFVVLVAQGQSGQDFRACANVPDVNYHTAPPWT